MLAASRADLSQAFCSYCGYPPMGPWRSRAHRVCMRCQMGIVLRAPPDAQPDIDEPFLIVDQGLRVQAISHRAEDVLMVKEPDVFGIPLEELLVSGNRYPTAVALGPMVDHAIGGTDTPARLELRPVRDPAIRLAGRVVRCTSPPAALLILSTLEPEIRRSTNGHPTGVSIRRPALQPASGQAA